MPDEISFSHDELTAALTEAQREFETLFGEVDAEESEEGLDGETADDLRKRRASTADEFSRAADTTQTSENANQAIRTLAEEAARSIDQGGRQFTDRQMPQGGGGGNSPAVSPPQFAAPGPMPGAYTGMGTAMGGPAPGAADPLGTMSGLGGPSAVVNPMAAGLGNAMAAGLGHAMAGMGANAGMPGMGGDMALGGASPQGEAVMNKILSGENPVATHNPAEGKSIAREELREAIYQMLKDEVDSEAYEETYSGGSEEGIQSYGLTSHDNVVAIELAEQYAASGIPYAWGGGHGAEPGPSQGISDGGGAADAHGDYNKVGLDCSGLARDYTWNLYGVDINGTAADQYTMGREVHPDDARPGDIYFPADAGVPPSHVGVYIGNGQFLEAQQSGTELMISELRPGTFRRMVD